MITTSTINWINWLDGSSSFRDKNYQKLFIKQNACWLASRYVGEGGECANFGLQYSHVISTGLTLYSSNGSSDIYNSCGLRAVVSLGSGVKIVGDESGVDKDNAITISK